jgi:hypothetical protein
VQAVEGIYENGTIRLLEDPHVSGPQHVYILFPEVERPTIHSVPASVFKLVDGIVSLGGHAPWRILSVFGRKSCAPQIILDTSVVVPRLDARDAPRQPALIPLEGSRFELARSLVANPDRIEGFLRVDGLSLAQCFLRHFADKIIPIIDLNHHVFSVMPGLQFATQFCIRRPSLRTVRLLNVAMKLSEPLIVAYGDVYSGINATAIYRAALSHSAPPWYETSSAV